MEAAVASKKCSFWGEKHWDSTTVNIPTMNIPLEPEKAKIMGNTAYIFKSTFPSVVTQIESHEAERTVMECGHNVKHFISNQRETTCLSKKNFFTTTFTTFSLRL